MNIQKGDWLRVIDDEVEFLDYGQVIEVLDTHKGGELIYIRDNTGYKMSWTKYEECVEKMTQAETDTYINNIIKETEF